MNKTAIKNFAIWARNKLISDITYKAGLLGITEKGIKDPLPQSTETVQFFDIGTREPSSIAGAEVEQRRKLVKEIQGKAKDGKHAVAFHNVMEEVAYTWFNRLIAIRFMEVNDYLPTGTRVLSSVNEGKTEPDLVTHALEVNLDYSAFEKDRIVQLKYDNKLDELFRMLFIKQCNALNVILPKLFERTNDYTELLLNISFTDKEDVVYHLVNDISEEDFRDAVQIIGWMYQYYNTEPKQEVFDALKKNVKITKEKIPAATQLFTPDWIVRYMVENSLGRLWLEGHPNDELKANWKYYLDEAEQEAEVQEKLDSLRKEYRKLNPEDVRVIDPCMGSGHILVYAFDMLMQIYRSMGYTEQDAARLILEKNLYGLDIDRRAYQLSYFSLMMKARHHNRRIFEMGVKPQVYYPKGFPEGEEFGSLVRIDELGPMPEAPTDVQVAMLDVDYETKLNAWNFKRLLVQTYDVVVTNPPYRASSELSGKFSSFLKDNYPDSRRDLFASFIERCIELLSLSGYQAMITQHAWMFLSSYENLRLKLLQRDIVNMAHLGPRAFEEIGGEVVQTTAFVLSARTNPGYSGTYVRLIDYTSQDEKEIAFLGGEHRYRSVSRRFEKIPGSPVAYWVGEKFFLNYENASFLSNFVDAMVAGNKTANNDQFLRFLWEVDRFSIGQEFQLYAKGGKFRKWFGNIEYVINWSNAALESYANNSSASLVRDEFRFKQGITFTDLTSKAFSCRLLEERYLFDMAGPGILISNDKLNYIMGLYNSVVVNEYLTVLSSTFHYKMNELDRVPILMSSEKEKFIDSIVVSNISQSRADWDSFETSWDFKMHPLVQLSMSGAYAWGDNKPTKRLSSAYKAWKLLCEGRFNQLKANEEELNSLFIEIYGLQDELTSEVENKDVTVRRADLGRDIRSLISYAVGCMFGRYSLDTEGLAYAGGDWDAGKYRSFIPDKDNILPICDDEYFDDDILGRFVDFIRVVYGEKTLEENLTFIADALGGKGNSPREIIRNYVLKDFFKDHCKIYKKRPIYWLFDSGKRNGFKALIYMHRYDEDTIGKLRVDYLHKMQRIYENEIVRMQDTIDNSTNEREKAAAIKRKEKLIKQLQETKEYDEKIAHLALARTPIDLDDGVKVNYEKIQTDRDGKKLEVLAKI